MAHWAKVDINNLVEEVTVGSNSDEDSGYTWIKKTIGGQWIQTSYNTHGGVHYTNGVPSADQSKALRKNYAGIGYTFDEERDAFIPPKPFESWVLNEDTCLWQPPTPYPNDGDMYSWDEVTGEWTLTALSETEE